MAEPLPSGSHTRWQHPLAPHKGDGGVFTYADMLHCMGDLSMKLPILPKNMHRLMIEGKQKLTQLVILETFLCLHKSWSAWGGGFLF